MSKEAVIGLDEGDSSSDLDKPTAVIVHFVPSLDFHNRRMVSDHPLILQHPAESVLHKHIGGTNQNLFFSFW